MAKRKRNRAGKKHGADKTVGIVSPPIKIREGDSKTELLMEAVERATIGFDYHKANMDRAENDTAFIFGDQYDLDDLKDKEEDNRLALTFNKLPQFINGVTGAQRSSVQTINISPTGASFGKDEPEIENTRGDSIKLSLVLTDLIRDIEYQSNAPAWYKMAFKHALEGGFGYLRVLTKYQDDGFDLDIQIKGIRDRWSVIIDHTAQEPDKSDMNWAFIHEKMPRKEFDKRYPGKSSEVVAGMTDNAYSTFWGDEETVTITEYFRREPTTKKIFLFSNGEIHDEAKVKDILNELAEQGITVVKERSVKTHKVIWCKISAGDILEPEIEFPTSTIPIVPMVGRESDLRGKRETKGLITDAIDAQVALNMMRSAALERIDSSPLAPWIATDKAIEGYEGMWRDANVTRFSTLVYKKGEQKPERDHGATMPTAELQITGVLDEDMKGSIGIFNASLGATSNEISGKAIKARQAEANVGTFEFIDNYQTAIRRVGLLCVELIPTIYDTERIIRTRGADGTDSTIEINKVIKDNDSGQDVVVNSLDFGKHTVVISSGASYETKREENAEQIIDLMKTNPKVAEVGSDLLVKNLDFSESDILAKRLERTVPTQLLSKEKQEELAKDAPEPQPSPEQIAAQAEQEKQKIEAEMQKLELESKIELEKIKLQIAETNLETKRVELANKEKEDQRNYDNRENDRKDTIAAAIADKMNGNKKTAE